MKLLSSAKPAKLITSAHPGNPSTVEQESLREYIVGAELTCVYFVRDYVQLAFEGEYPSTLTLLTDPTIFSGGTAFAWSDLAHHGALCQQIDHIVTAASIVPDEMLELIFDNDARLVASLRPEDAVGPEMVIFQAADTTWWVLQTGMHRQTERYN